MGRRYKTEEEIWSLALKGKFDNNAYPVVRSIVANLIYMPLTDDMREIGYQDVPKNRLSELKPYVLTPDMLRANGMYEQAMVMRVLQYCEAQGVDPTPERIIARLAPEVGEDKARQIVDTVLEYRTPERDVRYLAYGLGEWLQQQALKIALQEVATIAEESEYLYAERHREIMRILGVVAPPQHRRESASYLEAFDAAREQMARQAEEIRAGGKPGLELPWSKANELIPGGIPEGEMWVLSAASKIGKTTLMNEIARHIGFNVPGWMFLHLHLETSRFDLVSRDVARTTLIPMSALRDGTVHPNEMPWSRYFDDIRQDIIDHVGEGDYAKYHYEHVPNLTMDMLRTLLDDYQARAAAAKMRLVIGLDYFQRMAWWDPELGRGLSQSAGLNKLAGVLAAELHSRGVTAFVFAQDSIGDEERDMPFGGQEIIHNSKGHIQFTRKMKANEDLVAPKYELRDGKPYPVLDANGNEVPERDPLGNVVYFHRKGQNDSLITARIKRANSAMPGEWQLRMYNGRFKLAEPAVVDLTEY